MTWSISSLNWTTPEENVYEVHWTYGPKYGSVTLQPPGEDRVELSAVTEELAIQWVVAALGNEQVAAIKAPAEEASAESGLPWA